MTNPVAFRDFWGPRVRTTVSYRHTRYYQYAPALCDSALVEGGRGWGKSMGMEFDLLQDCICSPNKEILLTSWRRAHVNDRMNVLINWFRMEPFFGSFVPKTRGEPSIQRQPRYEISFRNGTVLYGASVGDDPLCANIQGPHPHIRYIEEGQFYPRKAFEKFQSTAHEAGTKDRFYGIRDGRRDTPWYEMDTDHLSYPQFNGHRFAVPQLASPYFNESEKLKKVKSLGGEDSSEYLNQVLAEWGEPLAGLWKLEDIQECMNPSSRMKHWLTSPAKMRIQPFDILLAELDVPPKDAKYVILAVDPAWSEATTILCFWEDGQGAWHTEWSVGMRNKVSQQDTARFISMIAHKMRANKIAIDTTGGDGRGVFQNLSEEGNPWSVPRSMLVAVGFNDTVVVDRVSEKDEYGYIMGVEEMKEERVIHNCINELRRLFHDRKISMPYSQKVLDEFNSETRKMGVSDWRIVVPRTVHVPETFRVFAHAQFMRKASEQEGELDAPATVEITAVKTGVLRSLGPGRTSYGRQRRGRL